MKPGSSCLSSTTVVDSSGKTPSGFIESTVTSLGDYDECIELKSPPKDDVQGKYCLIDIFPIGYKNHQQRNDGKISLNSMQHFNSSAYYFGICFPSKCSVQDVRTLVKHVLKPYPLMVEGDLTCDTQVREFSPSPSTKHTIFLADLIVSKFLASCIN